MGKIHKLDMNLSSTEREAYLIDVNSYLIVQCYPGMIRSVLLSRGDQSIKNKNSCIGAY